MRDFNPNTIHDQYIVRDGRVALPQINSAISASAITFLALDRENAEFSTKPVCIALVQVTGSKWQWIQVLDLIEQDYNRLAISDLLCRIFLKRPYVSCYLSIDDMRWLDQDRTFSNISKQYREQYKMQSTYPQLRAVNTVASESTKTTVSSERYLYESTIFQQVNTMVTLDDLEQPTNVVKFADHLENKDVLGKAKEPAKSAASAALAGAFYQVLKLQQQLKWQLANNN